MSLVALAHPEFALEDYARIQQFRREYDALFYDVVGPHVTLVFPVDDWAEADFVDEIASRARGVEAFDLCLRSACVSRDAFRDVYHVLLVPDEGFGRVVRLHDRLYAGRLFPRRRLDVDFIPHVGVANSDDPLQCCKWADSWNEDDFAIRGQVALIDVARYHDDRVRTIAQIPLA